MKISISILCFNEHKNVKILIKQSKKLIKKYKNLQIIFVDNGSTDNTSKVLEKMSISKNLKKVFIKKNIGYGFGVIKGLSSGNGDVIGWTHGDDLDFFNKIEKIQNFKFSKKNFFFKGQRKGKRPFLEIIFSYGFNIVSSFFLRKKLWDITAYPTLFTRNLYKKYKIYLPYDFSIDLYLFFFAKRDNYKIKRINFKYDKRKFGVSSWNKNFFSRIKLTINYILKILRLVYLDIIKI
ncbi:MAG: glycosyl transferase family 2 [Euryarchaeota archaeon]|nr:glycosyl transferase family 2 [Euryarchaeota archaeon]